MEKEKNSQFVPMSERITFGFGNLAANLMITTASAFITYFYTDVVGISVGMVGLILGAARIFDGISDLVMGSIIEKTANAQGKARPWLKWMAIPYALSLILLFSSPSFLPESWKGIYAFVTYVLAVAGVYTATMVPYNTMIGTTTNDSKIRGDLSTSRTIFGFAGALGVNAVVLQVVGMMGEVTDVSSWTKMAAVFGIVSTILLFITYANSKERAIVLPEKDEKANSITTKQHLKALSQNKYWIILILVMLIGFINSGLGGVNIYYAQWILNDLSKVATIGILSFLPILPASLVMPFLMAKFTKKSLMIVGNIAVLVGLGIMALFPENYEMILVGLVIRGVGFAPSAVAGFAMLGDVADYGEWKTGIRSDGLIFSAATFGEKVGSGLGAFIVGAVMAMGGYALGASAQSGTTLFAIKALFAYIPIIFAALSLVLMLFYNLEKEADQMQKDLAARRNHEQ